MKVFCDYVGLFPHDNSMIELFKNRLGWEVYFPGYSKDWEEHLDFNPYTLKINPKIFFNEFCDASFISFTEFCDISFDIIVSSLFETECDMYTLQQKYFPKAMFIRQINNPGGELPTRLPTNDVNLLIGKPWDTCYDQYNYITYTPEHDHSFDNIGLIESKPYDIFALRKYFRFSRDPQIINRATRDIHGLTSEDLYHQIYYNNRRIDILTEFDKQYLVDCSKNYKMYLHLKDNGDCGFTPREMIFAGVPVIVNNHWSKINKSPGHTIFVDGENCIDINPETRDINKSVELILEWTRPDVYMEKAKHAIEFTNNIIDYNTEAINIKKWIEKTIS